MGGVMMMPKHLLRCHPFVAESCFDVTRHDAECGDYYDIVQQDEEHSDNEGPEDNVAVPQEITDQVSTEGIHSSKGCYDRRSTFIVPTDPDCGCEVYTAKRSLSIKVHGREAERRRETVTAVAVRERGTDKAAQVIRFLFSLPPGIMDAIQNWVAVRRSNEDDQQLLHNRRAHVGTDVQGRLEQELSRRAVVLTKGQRCADWFILRQFRITGTIAGQILLSDGIVMSTVGRETQPLKVTTKYECLKNLLKSWFSSSRSTEHMMRGTKNETAVLNSLKGRPFILGAFECGMYALRSEPWAACSPDAIALLQLDEINNRFGTPIYSDPPIAVVEIKTSVAFPSLDVTLTNASQDVVYCQMGDDDFVRFIPLTHVGQLLQQALVLDVDFVVYVAASETGILFICVINIPVSSRQLWRSTLINFTKPIVSWAHQDSWVLPEELDTTGKRLVLEKLPFWGMVSKHVIEHGPMPPLKLFRHGLQTFYSRTKGGVGGSTQYRATIRSAMTVFHWEKKLITQTIKAVVSNAYIVWKINRNAMLLNSASSYGNIDKFRHNINQNVSFGNFVFDLCPRLIFFADKLVGGRDEDVQGNSTEIGWHTEEGKRLRSLVSKRKRHRVSFLNSDYGRRVRLHLQPHEQRHTPDSKHCALCGTGVQRNRSKFKCVTCAVHLCVRSKKDKRKSCWAKWHEAKRLEIVPSHTEIEKQNSNKLAGGGYIPTPSNSDDVPSSSTTAHASSHAIHACDIHPSGSISQPRGVQSVLKRTIESQASPADYDGFVATKVRRITKKTTSGSDMPATPSPPPRANSPTSSPVPVKPSESASNGSLKVHCASGCNTPPLLDPSNSGHVCEACSRPIHAFCVHAPGGNLGGEEYEGYGAGGYCKGCSLMVTSKKA